MGHITYDANSLIASYSGSIYDEDFGISEGSDEFDLRSMSKINQSGLLQTRYRRRTYLVGNYLLAPRTPPNTGIFRVWKKVPSKPPEEQVSLDKEILDFWLHVNRLHCHPYQNQIAFQEEYFRLSSRVTIIDLEKESIEATVEICDNVQLLSFYGECIQRNMSHI